MYLLCFSHGESLQNPKVWLSIPHGDSLSHACNKEKYLSLFLSSSSSFLFYLLLISWVISLIEIFSKMFRMVVFLHLLKSFWVCSKLNSKISTTFVSSWKHTSLISSRKWLQWSMKYIRLRSESPPNYRMPWLNFHVKNVSCLKLF